MTGVGGGIIIKSTLDFLGVFEVEEISLYSSLALIGMSSINMMLNRKRLRNIPWKIISGLTSGAIIGGIVGNRFLMYLIGMIQHSNFVVVIQSSVLIILISMTLFLIKKEFSMQLSFNIMLLIGIGMLLGFFAAMLSIGGGPINVAVLLFVFGFPMKVCALYSIIMIFFSQLSGFTTVGLTTGFTAYEVSTLALVFCTGVVGGLIGNKVAGLLSNEMTNRLFIYVLFCVIFLSVLNIVKAL